ncbi:hypothetical protein BDW72DRAFT_181625 [Aspergillus terricola var. indicus]
MHCNHCSREFSDQSQLIAHYEEHAAIQDRLQHTRVYGARYERRSHIVSADPEQPSSTGPGNDSFNLEERVTGKTTTRLSDISRFMNQENDLLVFRRFSELSIQNLVHMQTEIADLEQRVKKDSDSASTIPWDSTRKQLMDTLSEKLEKYHKALLIQSQLRKLKRPQDEYIKILSDWAEDSKLLDEADGAFLADRPDVRGDLVTLGSAGDRKVWAYRVVEKLVWRLLVKNKKRGGTIEFDHGGVLYTYNDEAIATIVRVLLTVLTSVLLIVPIIILYFFRTGANALTVVTVCTVAVAVLIALSTDCRNHEILMAAAA